MIRWIGKALRVANHPCVEHDFPAHGLFGAKAIPIEDGAVLEDKSCCLFLTSHAVDALLVPVKLKPSLRCCHLAIPSVAEYLIALPGCANNQESPKRVNRNSQGRGDT